MRRKLLLQFLAFCFTFFVELELRNFGLDLRLEFIGSPLEFGQGLAYLTGDAGQLLRTKKQQRQNEQNNRVGKTHSPIIAGSGSYWLSAVVSGMVDLASRFHVDFSQPDAYLIGCNFHGGC